MLIVGGGAAGSCLARQLIQAAPDLRIAVADRAKLPRPAETLRLGESTSEIGAGYLEERLGLGGHLREVHHAKAGLRFFFRRAPGSPFGERAEYGGNTPIPGIWTMPFDETNPPTFQLHRGRLEAHLIEGLDKAGVQLLGASTVREVVPGDPHKVRIERGDETLLVEARWVIDASARAGVVRHHFTSVHHTGHSVRASWGWVRARLDPDAMSASDAYRDRCPLGVRWRGTSHLMGEGYWIWIIAHPDELTSVGLVTDGEGPHPELGELMDWLEEHEPELHAQISAGGGLEQLSGGRFEATGVTALIGERLAAVGDAAATADALYSPGLDLIAMSNDLVAATVLADHRGEPTARNTRYANVIFPQLHRQYMLLYRDLYELTASPRVLAAKIAWDNAVYFAFTAPWVRSPDFADPRCFGTIGPLSIRVAELHERMQDLFVAWARGTQPGPARGVFDQNLADFLMRPLRGVQERRSGPELRELLAAELQGLEQLAVTVFRRAAADMGLVPPEGPLNAYALDLDPANWQGLTAGRQRRDSLGDEVAGLWLSS